MYHWCLYLGFGGKKKINLDFLKCVMPIRKPITQRWSLKWSSVTCPINDRSKLLFTEKL